MNPDDLIAAFNELAVVDDGIRIDRNVVGDCETVRVVSDNTAAATWSSYLMRTMLAGTTRKQW